MSNVHIAYRVDAKTLVHNPEIVLQRMSFKILEKREQALNNLVNTKVTFSSPGGLDVGTLQSIQNNTCNIKVNGEIIKVSLKKLIL